ncbi:MAG: hypothetical protein SFY32_16830 [Bacteroidota bacterium]|nr:hypothetical protein [Bacteroidota bacterium]
MSVQKNNASKEQISMLSDIILKNYVLNSENGYGAPYSTIFLRYLLSIDFKKETKNAFDLREIFSANQIILLSNGNILNGSMIKFDIELLINEDGVIDNKRNHPNYFLALEKIFEYDGNFDIYITPRFRSFLIEMQSKYL